MSSAIVLGAGHNGLVAAFYLARAGVEVTVVEGRDVVGGACKTEELIPGYRFSTCANVLVWLRPRVAADMRLLERGVNVRGGTAARVLDGHRPFVWWGDRARLAEQIATYSTRDAAAWERWVTLWHDAARLLGPFLLSYPPTAAELTARARDLGLANLLDTLLTRSLADLVDEHFESPELRNCFSPPHDVGSLHDVGSALMQGLAAAMETYTETGSLVDQGFVDGGMGRLTEAMRAAAEEAGATVLTGCPVECIEIERGRSTGVRLADGTKLSASVVLANTDPKRTFLQLLDRTALPARLAARVRALRTEVAPLKLPRRCLLAAMTPTVADPSLAPPGHHTTSFWIQFAPVTPAEGTWESRRDEMAELLLAQIAEHSPNLRDALYDYVLLAPTDLEDRVSLTDGNIHHVDISLDQALWRRPLPELSRYRTPIECLYLCGAGQHPYGEVSGAPGHNAAHAVLEDLGLVQSGSWEERHGDGQVVSDRVPSFS